MSPDDPLRCLIVQPPFSEVLEAGDKLVLFGGHAPLADVLTVLAEGEAAAGPRNGDRSG